MDFEWYRVPSTGGRIRIMANLGENVGHWVNIETRSGRPGLRRQPCSGEACEFCQDTDSLRRDHSVLSMVIDRHDGKLKMFEMRGQILRGLRDALMQTRIRNKDFSRFDVLISKTGHPPFVRYGVAFDRPKPLRQSEEIEARNLLASMIARLRPNCRLV
jgi:hypothetical protein